MIPNAQSAPEFGGVTRQAGQNIQQTAQAFNAPRLGQQSQVQAVQPQSQYAQPGVAAQSQQHAALTQSSMQARAMSQLQQAQSLGQAQRGPATQPQQFPAAGGGQQDFSRIPQQQDNVNNLVASMGSANQQQQGTQQAPTGPVNYVTNNYGPGNPGSQRQSFEPVPPVSGLQASVAPEMEGQVGFTSSNPANAAARVQNLYQDRRIGNGNGGGQYE